MKNMDLIVQVLDFPGPSSLPEKKYKKKSKWLWHHCCQRPGFDCQQCPAAPWLDVARLRSCAWPPECVRRVLARRPRRLQGFVVAQWSWQLRKCNPNCWWNKLCAIYIFCDLFWWICFWTYSDKVLAELFMKCHFFGGILVILSQSSLTFGKICVNRH